MFLDKFNRMYNDRAHFQAVANGIIRFRNMSKKETERAIQDAYGVSSSSALITEDGMDSILVGNVLVHLRYCLSQKVASSRCVKVKYGNSWCSVIYKSECGRLVTSDKSVEFNIDDFLKYDDLDIDIDGFSLSACTLEETETQIIIELPCCYIYSSFYDCAKDRLGDISGYRVLDLTYYKNGSVIALDSYGNQKEFKVDNNGEGYLITEDGLVEVSKIYFDKFKKLDNELVCDDLLQIARSRTNIDVWVNDKPITGVSLDSNITLITDNSSDNRVSYKELRLLLKTFSSKKLLYKDEEIMVKPAIRGSRYVYDTQKYFARIKMGYGYIKSYILYKVTSITESSIFIETDTDIRTVDINERGTALYADTKSSDGKIEEITLFGSLEDIHAKMFKIMSSFQ